MNLNFRYILLAVLSVVSSVALATDPCRVTTGYTGGEIVRESTIQDMDNGFNYELWHDRNVPGKLTVYGGDADCAFKAEWDNSGDFIARVGYFWGKEGTSPKYSELDADLHAEFNFVKTGNSHDYSFVGIYGWTKKPDIVEYYIVDDSYNRMTTPWNTKQIGSVVVDGATYNIYSGRRTNAPSIYDYSDFTQVFSIRQGGTRQCGHISITEHFKAWEKLGIKTGELYDCKIFIETGGDKGSIDFKYATMWVGDENGPLPTEEREPYKELVIPGLVEAEDYDKGGQNIAYHDNDRENKGKLYRNDRVDIVESPTGYAIGYTESGEWLEYTVNVESDGMYEVEAALAHGDNDPAFKLSVDGDSVCTLTCKGQESWDNYAIAKQSIKLKEGTHVLRLDVSRSYSNIDFLKFTKIIPESCDNYLAEDVFVTPNPAAEAIEVKGNGIVYIELFDMLGNKLLRTEHTKIDLTQLSSNNYILRVVTADGVATRKVTVRR